ncbi:M56 family metallopeptidase [Pedobacter psychroterrae]|uniref:Peptidase M56 domain-containing protein n=1 Tax=Pedobacter psychroterrae TaxID=2530453 RepID=A0A4R0NJQ6_9SPHI|nr:M56 family metallopeptidase [Pedobacter psychroterrae]TCD00058.1 hypothetical protein EZ437_15170 [Pedobacter psychroterrae]
MEVQNAIYLTLLHSLWMGLVLALATGIVIVATKKSNASTRYNLLTALLFVFVLAVGFVFYQSLTGKIAAVNSSNTQIAPQHLIAEQTNSPAPVATESSFMTNINSVVSLWSSYANQIVLIWFLIICAKCIQLMVGLHSIYYLKRTQLFIAGKFWENKVAELSKKLGINKKISIFQSGIAKVPMIAGYFKPVILMPIGMLNGISTAEVEAILSHELAHLKRNDYLVNIIQSLIEIVFFFNPGVLWISKLIREERENCCDDLALHCIENKHQYIKALIACQEFRTDHTSYAMAITGKKNHLKERVNRMIFDNNSTLNKMEKTILTITLISALTVTAAFNNINQVAGHKEVGHVVVNNPFITDGQPFCMIDEPMMGPDVSLMEPISVVQDTSKKWRNKNTSVTKRTTISSNTNTNTDEQKEQLDEKIEHAIASERDKASFAADRARQAADKKQYAEDKKKYEEDKLQYLRDAERYAEDVGKHVSNSDKFQEPVAPKAPQAPKAPNAPTPPKAPRAPRVPSAPNAPNFPSAPAAPSAPKAPDMTADLVKDGLLKDTKNFTYKMNTEELTINGVKQSDAVHKKYMGKYMKNKRGTISTTVNTD